MKNSFAFPVFVSIQTFELSPCPFFYHIIGFKLGIFIFRLQTSDNLVKMVIIKELLVFPFVIFIQIACQMPYFITLLLYYLFVGLAFRVEKYHRPYGKYGYCFNHRILSVTGSYLPMINCIKLITKAEMIKAIHVFQLPKPPSREILSLFLTSFGSCFISSSSRSSITWFATTSSCSSVMPLSCSMVNERNSSFVIMLCFQFIIFSVSYGYPIF